VPKARRNRAQGANEYGLDLLETYLAKGKNLTDEEKAFWQGAYNLTVLDEALGRVVAFLDRTTSVKDLVAAYPSTPHRVPLESLMAAIGRGELTFSKMRRPGPDAWSPAIHGFMSPSATTHAGSSEHQGEDQHGAPMTPRRVTAEQMMRRGGRQRERLAQRAVAKGQTPSTPTATYSAGSSRYRSG
jgi:hypothetical protein